MCWRINGLFYNWVFTPCSTEALLSLNALVTSITVISLSVQILRCFGLVNGILHMCMIHKSNSCILAISKPSKGKHWVLHITHWKLQLPCLDSSNTNMIEDNLSNYSTASANHWYLQSSGQSGWYSPDYDNRFVNRSVYIAIPTWSPTVCCF